MQTTWAEVEAWASCRIVQAEGQGFAMKQFTSLIVNPGSKRDVTIEKASEDFFRKSIVWSFLPDVLFL